MQQRFATASIAIACTLLLAANSFSAAEAGSSFQFDFGSGLAPRCWTRISPTTIYSANSGYGFESGAKISSVNRGGKDRLLADFVTSEQPFLFSVALQEGNYNVTVIFGDAGGES